MNTAVQFPEPKLQACCVVIPGHAIHTGGGLALERIECHPERIDIDVVQERGEPFFLPLPCRVPYAVQALGPPRPDLRPGCAVLAPFPSAPALRSTDSATGCPASFTGFIATMAGS